MGRRGAFPIRLSQKLKESDQLDPLVLGLVIGEPLSELILPYLLKLAGGFKGKATFYRGWHRCQFYHNRALAASDKSCPLLHTTNHFIITIMQHYPNHLRELRQAKGMLQIEVAQLLGHLNSDRMSDWEKGYGMPSVANLFKLATVYGVSAEELYREIRATAMREVEEKRITLENENEWVRRMRLREATKVQDAA